MSKIFIKETHLFKIFNNLKINQKMTLLQLRKILNVFVPFFGIFVFVLFLRNLFIPALRTTLEFLGSTLILLLSAYILKEIEDKLKK